MRTPDEPLPTDDRSPELPATTERRLRLRALRASWVKDVVQAVAVTAAGLWAVYNFWYRETYLPKIVDANLNARVTVQRLGATGDVEAFRVLLLTDNPGQATARILGITLDVSGLRLQPDPPRPAALPDAGTPLAAGDYTSVDRTVDSKSDVVYSNAYVPESFDGRSSSTVQPSGHGESEQVFFVRRGQYAVLTFTARVTWLPFRFPLHRDCYRLARKPDGTLEIRSRPGVDLSQCRVTTSGASASIAMD